MFEVDGIYFKQKFNYLVVAGVSEVIKSDIVIPNEINGFPIKEIANYAFQNVRELESISFSGEIDTIGEKAFYHCKNLKMVCFLTEISHQVKIKEQAFACCESLFEIWGNIDMILEGEYIFHNCKSLVKTPMQINGEIPVGTFSGCKKLNILFFKNVTNVNTAAFLDCKDVKKIFILNDFKHTNDFFDGWEHVEIICQADSKFAELAYKGYLITLLGDVKTY